MTTNWTIDGVKEALAAKKISARELAADYYARIEAKNPELNAYLTLSPERARRQTDRIDAMVAAGQPLPPLAGVPVAIKDVISTRVIKTTCGSKILENYFPPYDATAVERLESAGAVILGKTNCDEFAMGSSNENSAYGPVKNPLATDRVPGGSSGGSAAVVAAGLAVASLGTDTGGSIRQPGSFCGIPAMMGSYGRVSRYGLIAFASSLDRIGPFATNVKDVASILQTIAGRDPHDSTSTTAAVPNYRVELEKPVKGCGWEFRRIISRKAWMRGYGKRLKPASKFSRSWDANWSRFECRTRTTRLRLTTLLRRRKRVPTWRGLTACGLDCG
jgi:aspartyl-tRNA(Asn)/glutamyl-tRNA(Gln) amidotransferase subunit A